MFGTFARSIQALIACVTLLTIALTLPAPTRAQAAERCFPETGFCISGAIRTYWETNGGLPVFGYPIAPQRTETIEGSWTGPTQWFERDRLEDHANEGAGVLAGRLGAQYLDHTGHPWQRGQGANLYPYNPECRTFFNETGYQVCGSLRAYWENNGGLARFGYPISEPIHETIEGTIYTVQYFERRRMEEHPELPNSPVLLGLLGRSLFNTGVVSPQPAANDVASATQQAILDAAYASARGQNPRGKLAVGLVDVTGDSAVALAQPFGSVGFTVALHKRGGTWQVVPATETPGGNAAAIIDASLKQLEDPHGQGLTAYVTRPRIAGDWARVAFAPGASENRDSSSVFFKRTNNDWRFVTAGTAFPEDDLRALGVPQALWSYGEGVRGPNS